MNKVHHWPNDPPGWNFAKVCFGPILLWCGTVRNDRDYEWSRDPAKVTCDRCLNSIEAHNRPSKTYLPVEIV